MPDLIKRVLIVIILIILWGTIALFLWPKDTVSTTAGVDALAGARYAPA